ncbi:MAG: TIGR01777 family protein [Flavobacteriales bacterium]|nr:TIGR01777 family protein [Flavobacteriales bacterium]
MSTILITGGSGLIGSALTKALLAQGRTVRHLSRTPRDHNGVRAFAWDPQRGTLDKSALEGVDHIVHLAGENIITKRWSPERLRLCQESRTESARLVLSVAREMGLHPKSFISASGVGYYGAVTTDKVFSESDPNAQDVIGRLTRAWEDAVDEWTDIVRVVKLRTPMVLAREGGGLPQFLRLAQWCVLAPLGSGKQWMPWVHMGDLVQLYIHAMEHGTMSGAYNACAGEQLHQRDVMRAVAKAVRRPLFPIAVPAFALRLAMGERSALLTEGSRASSQRRKDAGLTFEFDTLESALRDLIGQN